ncbi:hypothetical protein BGZ57DRAFT_992937 [Hyaloscypha finlandica]|nr:hypothetical protein BGZ57DRAFT_992937 [Hyaloscypha finlandica]KAH8786351.1 hypothetical protein F5882DRAFT_497033 [Hyaloscypha sp. PMI_1271]
MARTQGQKKAGIPATAFEKNAALFSPGERDETEVPNATFRRSTTSIRPSGSQYSHEANRQHRVPNGRPSEVMGKIDTANFHRLHRPKLRALLSPGLDIRWNRRLRDIVVGSDEGRVTVAYPPGTFATFGLQDAPEEDTPEDWSFSSHIAWKEEQDEERKTFGNKEGRAQVKDKSRVYCDSTEQFETRPTLPERNWDNKNGRVTLAGDAGHSMTYRMCSPQWTKRSGKLVGFLTSESDRRSAVGKYDEEMKARAGEGLRTSVMNTTMLHDCEQVMTSAALMTAGLKKAT